MDTPYKFDAANHRVVTNIANNNNKVTTATTFIYVMSLVAYNRRFLRVDGNGVAAGAFAILSLPAAYTYAKFFFDSPENAAAIINNQREGRY